MAQKKIVVIEDDKDILTVLGDQLELDDYEVFRASTGEEGKKLIDDLEPDLIILDLNLPDIDGVKLCQRVRQASDVPIIMLTARDSISDKVRGFECGADDYIVKPFEYLELAARIKACLRRSLTGNPKKSSRTFGILKVVTDKRQVFVGDNGPTSLTRKEFELLEIFINNPGKLLTREFLCNQLWPKNEIYPWSRSLDVHIRRLRKKIEPDPDNPRLIITHSGVGYRFEPDPEQNT